MQGVGQWPVLPLGAPGKQPDMPECDTLLVLQCPKVSWLSEEHAAQVHHWGKLVPLEMLQC